jgi:transposase
LAKNDAIDADMIAWFAETFDQAPLSVDDEQREELDHMVSARLSLIHPKTQIVNFSEHAQPAAVDKAHQAILRTLDRQLGKLEAAIAAAVQHDPRWADRAEIIESVPGLGITAAAGLIAFMPELGRIDNKAAAALLGVAPYDDDSGKHSGRRFIKGGRRKLRNLLYMPIMGALPATTPCSRPAISASVPRESRRRSLSSPACASSSPSSTP